MAKKPIKAKDKKKEEKPRVHKDLAGFDIEINNFGEIRSSYDIDKINQFLNQNVDDKKLRHREDIEELKRGKTPEPEETASEETDFDEQDLPRFDIDEEK